MQNRFFAQDMAFDESMALSARSIAPSFGNDFAPEVEERKITKSASLGIGVERGEFSDTELRLRSIVDTSDSILLSENSYSHGEGRLERKTGNYQIKVESSKYTAVVTQLKELGEVTSLSESQDDITARFLSIEDQLATERARLVRYQGMFEDATDVNDKIQLSDRIFNQERTIKYLEDRLNRVDLQVEYSTVHVSIHEEQSKYAHIAFVTFADLVRKLVSSINTVLGWIFVLVPYAIIALLVWLVVRKVRR